MLIEELLISSVMHLKDLEDFCQLFQNVVLLNELNFWLECEVEKMKVDKFLGELGFSSVYSTSSLLKIIYM